MSDDARLAELEAQMARMQDAYAQKLGGKLNDLVLAIENARHEAPDSTSSLEAAKALAHQLHGTAGSYGFAEIGDAAARAERLLEQLLEIDTTPEDARWSEAAAAIREAQQHLP